MESRPICVAAVVLLATLTVVQPTAAAGVDRLVMGTVERVIHEAEGFGQADPADHHNHISGTSVERVYVVTDEGTSLSVPLDLAHGLVTGQRVLAKVATHDPDTARAVTVSSAPRALTRYRPQPEIQALPYALVSVQTPDTSGTPATIAEVSRWLLDATQSFFDREAAESFAFKVHSTHSVSMDQTLCEKESEAVAKVRRQLGLPTDVGIVLIGHNDTCRYAGRATLGAAEPGQWVVMNYESPSIKSPQVRPFYENQGREITIHEIGHNLGLDHSRRWRCATGSSPLDPGARDCAYSEYGSQSSVMGSGPEGGALDSYERWQLGVYGPGRMLSVEAGAGAAVLVDDRTPLLGLDSGEAPLLDGLPVVRALHLRDPQGEVWLSAREPLTSGGLVLQGGVVALLSRQVASMRPSPVQADVVPDYPSNSIGPGEREAYYRGVNDIIVSGASFSTPGGTLITVGAAVSTPHGLGYTVSWRGIDRDVRVPAAPSVSQGWSEPAAGTTPWLRPRPSKVSLPSLDGEYASCSIVDQTARTVTSWKTGPLNPVPGDEWWVPVWLDEQRAAWSVSLGRLARATWRMPLTGMVDQIGRERNVQLTPGTATWSTQCEDFMGRTSTSQESTQVRVDGTAPIVSGGTFEVLGLATIMSDGTALNVRVPAYSDSESGLAGRTGACASGTTRADVSLTCPIYVQRRSGIVSGGAVDKVGNVSEKLSAGYSLTSIRPVRRSTEVWNVSEGEAYPQEVGASITVKVQGRSAGVQTACGKGTGRIEVRVNGKQPKSVDLAKSGRPDSLSWLCTAIVVDLPEGESTITITYRSLGDYDGYRIDRLTRVTVLK